MKRGVVSYNHTNNMTKGIQRWYEHARFTALQELHLSLAKVYSSKKNLFANRLQAKVDTLKSALREEWRYCADLEDKQ